MTIACDADIINTQRHPLTMTPPPMVFNLVLIKPSHYDADGYVIQWLRSAMPANTLATLAGLARNCAERKVLGEDVELAIHAFDETNTRIRVHKLIRLIRQPGHRGLVGLVGVQSNQFPRALDIARAFREADIPVCIGGFHVSGCMAMLSELPEELKQAQTLGISLYAGEAEGRLDEFLRDAYHQRLKPVYNHLNNLPSISNTPAPILRMDRIARTVGRQASFDAGRGCPFQCSFCTIINVQGHQSRFRTPDDVERIVCENLAQGVKRFFITDDNFARNRNWESIFDRLIAIRARDDAKFNLVIQVDTLCHKIPKFVEKAQLAGVKRVFIGLESINPETLKRAKKRQNRITEYRTMLQAWRRRHVFTVVGYILGFPGDTPQSIQRDLEIIKHELPIDLIEFFFLTPLPGSEDHKKLYQAGVAMDDDLNRYDLNHVTTAHPSMTRAEWEATYRKAWASYYNADHVRTVLQRARANGINLGKVVGGCVTFYFSILYEHVHPLETGVFRLKFRRDRRFGMALENPLVFYSKYLASIIYKHWKLFALAWTYQRMRKAIAADPAAAVYSDTSLTPVDEEELAILDMYSNTAAARAEVVRVQDRKALSRKIRASMK